MRDASLCDQMNRTIDKVNLGTAVGFGVSSFSIEEHAYNKGNLGIAVGFGVSSLING